MHHCLNLHLLLKSINIYCKSKSLPLQNSLTDYINRVLGGECFEKSNNTRLYIFHSYQQIIESYTGKEGKQAEYTKTAFVDECKPFKHLVALIKNSSPKFKKHQNYVDNCSTVFPLKKHAYTRKFTELEIFQNLALGPKFQLKSAHFFQKTIYSSLCNCWTNDKKHNSVCRARIKISYCQLQYFKWRSCYNTGVNILLGYFNHWLS